MSWRECTLGEVVRFQRGHDLPDQDRKPGDVPVIGSAGPNGWHNEAKARGPGVSIGRSGASIGKVTYTPTDYWPHNACLFVTDFLGNDPRFVYYFLKTKDLTSLNSGAAQPSLNRNFVHLVPVRVPGGNEQRAIADILSAYDDLIETNRRRIALLEEAARLLYREWFVHFRFPGHEHVPRTDGLPEGWERRAITDLADIYRGKSYKSSELVEDGGQPFINLKCFERGGGFRVSGLKWFRGEHKEHHRAEAGDIVIAVTDMTRDAMIVAQAARVPRTVGENAIYSMDLVKAAPKEGIDPLWFYGMLRFSRFSAEVREEATGATVLHLKPKHIEAWHALVAPRVLRGLFSEQFSAILDQVDNLELQNEKLAQTRDLLLPRLMNGDIAV
ncbi:hypothetical protein LPB142_08540 [Rhodobacter xanthinilyticus]|uniref:Type I restriction modification DNA specificity domain-containing protein n=1 Tax=Rhodobacter xanthinilyticus TaxID=1850250 RepID=A0A1D9MBV3_9RHOB|nr:restriction endonuclease subunit S [Rhodobacter xanthinilyticus]AOZ69354.1 hypothetical protein LPB142_08540 [Rhodobacter xanthinilyticus]